MTEDARAKPDSGERGSRASGAPRAAGRPARSRHRPLSRELILCAALRLVDDEGLPALTMRRLGEELGVDPMAVYRHVPDKAALLDGIGELVWTNGLRFDDLDPGLGWRDALGEVMLRFRNTLLEHPRALELMTTHPMVTDEQYDMIERGLAMLTERGLTLAPQVLRLLNSLAVYTMGHALAEVGEPAGGAGGVMSLQRLEQLRTEHPLFATLVPDDSAFDPDRQYREGLDALLDGWQQRLQGS